MVEAVAQVPARGGGDDRLQRSPALGELIARPPGRAGRCHEAALGQRAQACRQHARRDAAARPQLLEAERPAQQVADQHQRPAVADHVQGAADRTEDLAGREDRTLDYLAGHLPTSYSNSESVFK
jgi:hypothetical protein